MSKKAKHEDHTNHEAWAIPYGDLVTLLLALFVCMYAMSSVNEGKYRVLSDSLSQAFGGPPRSMKPVQVGDKQEKGTQANLLFRAPNLRGFEKQPAQAQDAATIGMHVGGLTATGDTNKPAQETEKQRESQRALEKMAGDVQAAMKDLIARQLVIVRQSEHWLEIQIRTDILFASGSAGIAGSAQPILQKLADILSPFPNPIRIEGHTDNVPITTTAFPSNWELSAARAASVVHLFTQNGVQAPRMSVAGFAEFRPEADNRSSDGRNRNRRVVIVVGEMQDAPVPVTEDGEPAAPVHPSIKPAQSSAVVPASTTEVPHG